MSRASRCSKGRASSLGQQRDTNAIDYEWYQWYRTKACPISTAMEVQGGSLPCFDHLYFQATPTGIGQSGMATIIYFRREVGVLVSARSGSLARKALQGGETPGTRKNARLTPMDCDLTGKTELPRSGRNKSSDFAGGSGRRSFLSNGPCASSSQSANRGAADDTAVLDSAVPPRLGPSVAPVTW